MVIRQSAPGVPLATRQGMNDPWLRILDKFNVADKKRRKSSKSLSTCPELSPEQREANRLTRLEIKEKEERAAREVFSAPIRGLDSQGRLDTISRNSGSYMRRGADSDSDRKTLDQ
ncbi:hypothetical protein F2Q69_00032322 [Brassica cretica]|uniref:Uncharacterized protein n=1 Tax=Brassica cretica TaxID=69181 RepID=A0A8S9S9P8_BRACR|nr:hypothetical protein F2Q69_00032322 [Brassica cretica]